MGVNPAVRQLSNEDIMQWFEFMQENGVAWCAMKQAALEHNLPGPGTVLEQIPRLVKDNEKLKEQLREARVRAVHDQFRDTDDD